MPIKVAVGSYNYLYGEGLKKLLEGETEIHIVGIFDEEVDIREIVKIAPDVVLLEFSMFQNLAELPPDSPIKFLLIIDRKTYSIPEKRIAQLISKGVVGILPPGADSELLRRAVKATSSGELWLDRKTMSNILSQEHLSKKGEIKLSKSEKEVAALICQGYRNKEIALKLDVSEQTVKSHCNRIYKKVGISDRLQLAIYFMQGGN
jgi:DNA-binding NarL/FixJ family response regulator